MRFMTPSPKTRDSDVADFYDFVTVSAAGCRDVDDVARALAHQRARDRRRDGDAPGFDVGLVLTDDLVADGLAVVLVFEIDRGTEDHLAAAVAGRRIDDLG